MDGLGVGRNPPLTLDLFCCRPVLRRPSHLTLPARHAQQQQQQQPTPFPWRLTRHILLIQALEQAGCVHIQVLHSCVSGAGAPGGAEACRG